MTPQSSPAPSLSFTFDRAVCEAIFARCYHDRAQTKGILYSEPLQAFDDGLNQWLSHHYEESPAQYDSPEDALDAAFAAASFYRTTLWEYVDRIWPDAASWAFGDDPLDEDPPEWPDDDTVVDEATLKAALRDMAARAKSEDELREAITSDPRFTVNPPSAATCRKTTRGVKRWCWSSLSAARPPAGVQWS